MEEYIDFDGTKKKIADELREMLCDHTQTEDRIGPEGWERFASGFIEILEKHYDTLSEEEDFEKNVPRSCVARNGLVAADAEYYISIKRATCIFFLLVAARYLSKDIDPLISALISKYAAELTRDKEGILFYRPEEISGESCIILEAAGHRKEGIDKNFFAQYKGECINNQLRCRYDEDGRCSCQSDRVEEICKKFVKEKILKKSGNRYFYNDFV